MIIKNIQINDAQLKNLEEFLNRTTLKGIEVGAFVEVSNVLFSTPEPEVTKKQIDNVAIKDLEGQKKSNGSKAKK